MGIFRPTYLYVKQHSVTKLKYFGKTISQCPKRRSRYYGSGKYWNLHLDKHGRDHVVTVWEQLFTDEADLKEFAAFFSEFHEVVKSDEWANLRPETGIDGGRTKEVPWNKGVKTNKPAWNKGVKMGPSPYKGVKRNVPAWNKKHATDEERKSYRAEYNRQWWAKNKPPETCNVGPQSRTEEEREQRKRDSQAKYRAKASTKAYHQEYYRKKKAEKLTLSAPPGSALPPDASQHQIDLG